MNALLRIAGEMRAAEQATGDRAYDRLRACVAEGIEIDLSDHELIQACSRALWHREYGTVQLGLTELEIRTAADAVRALERAA